MRYLPTEEQKKIVRSYKKNNNIRIEANAGSGKTSTCMFLAEADKNKDILLLTFNRQLTNESKEKFKGMENVSVQTIHGFIKGMYKQEGYDTQMLLNVYIENIRPEKKEHFDVLILDEFQDFSQLMVKLVFKSLYWINKDAQIVILGSYPQCIYQFFEADERCLQYCEKYLVENSEQWKTLKLTESFRLTRQMQMFVNKVVLNREHFSIRGEEEEEEKKEDVILWIGNPYDKFCDWFYENIAQNYNPEQIFILAPSVARNQTSDSPIVRLQKYLTDKSYEFYVIDTMSEKVADEYSDNFKSITKGKTIISTYHSAKGCERDVVIVFNFDKTYFKFYAKNKQEYECTNPQYVALTRARKKLILLQNNNQMLEFIKKERLKECCKILPSEDVIEQQQKKETIEKERGIQIKVLPITHLIKQQKSKDFYYFSKKYNYVKKEKYPRCEYRLKNRVEGKHKGRYEDVSDFNGNICTLYLQYIKTGELPTFKKEDMQSEFLDKLFKKTKQKSMDIKKKLYYIVQIMYIQRHGYTHRLSQVKNWIRDYHLESIEKQFENYIERENKDLEFEKGFVQKVRVEEIQKRNIQIYYDRMYVKGVVDIIDKKNKRIIEVKYVKQLLPHHYQQLFFYYILINITDESYKDYTYEIFNVKQGQLYQLKIEKKIQNYKELMYRIIRSKFAQQESQTTDKEFLDDIQEYYSFVRGEQLQYDFERQLKLED